MLRLDDLTQEQQESFFNRTNVVVFEPTVLDQRAISELQEIGVIIDEHIACFLIQHLDIYFSYNSVLYDTVNNLILSNDVDAATGDRIIELIEQLQGEFKTYVLNTPMLHMLFTAELENIEICPNSNAWYVYYKHGRYKFETVKCTANRHQHISHVQFI